MSADVTRAAQLRARWVLPYIALLALLVPVLAFVVLLPHSTPHRLRWMRLDDPAARWAGVALLFLLALNFGYLLIRRLIRADEKFAVGALTLSAALTAVLAFFSVHLRTDRIVHADVIALVLFGIAAIALWLIAHDWTRTSLIIATALVVVGFGVFVLRIGYEDLRVPSLAQRKAVAAVATSTERQLKVGVVPVPDSTALDRAINKVKAPQLKDQVAWQVRKRALDIELAAFRAKVTGSKADATALQALLAVPITATVSVSMLDALTHGADVLWRSGTHSLDPLAPGPLGWIVIALLALGAWGLLLQINATRMTAQVSIPDDAISPSHTKAANGSSSKDGPTTTDNLLPVLRIAVLQNLPEPGPAPGASTSNPVTDLIGVAGPGGKVLQTLVNAVLAVAGRRYGYQVTVDLSTDEAVKKTTALVRVKSLSGRKTVATQMLTKKSESEAVRAAGLWAAGFILRRSTRIPGWATWDPQTASALSTATGERLSVDQMSSALREAPSSGLLLVQLGTGLEQQGRRCEAIERYARAVTAYPGYLIARYRLAAALGMMRHDTTWASRSKLERSTTLRPVRAAAIAMHWQVGSAIDDLTGDSTDGYRQGFADLATILFAQLCADARWPFRMITAIRRTEREPFFSTVLHPSRERIGMFALADSARLALEHSAGALESVRKKADARGSWWQVSYNAACGWASVEPRTSASADTALGLLEQTLTKQGVHQLDGSWAEQDPDLAALRGEPRFTAFVSQLRKGE